MKYNIDNELILSQRIRMLKKYSNKEILLLHYFQKMTKIVPENVILINKIIFFFVKPTDYFKSKNFQYELRKKIINQKLVIISSENTLIKQIFNFFPDTYIHDIIIKPNKQKIEQVILVHFLSYEERGIAVGQGGNYIKAINEIFQKYFILENNNDRTYSFQIRCKFIML